MSLFSSAYTDDENSILKIKEKVKKTCNFDRIIFYALLAFIRIYVMCMNILILLQSIFKTQIV